MLVPSGESCSDGESDVAAEYLPVTARRRYPVGRRAFVFKDAHDEARVAVPKTDGVLLPVPARRAALRLPARAGCVKEYGNRMSARDSGVHQSYGGLVCRFSKCESGLITTKTQRSSSCGTFV